MTIIETVERHLKRINYRRRTRRINILDIADVLHQMLRSGVGFQRGGTVANAYDYPADTAAVAAVKLDDGTIALQFGVCGAKRSASPVTWFGPSSRRWTDIESWRASMTRELLDRNDWLVISRHEMETLIEMAKIGKS
jgi:hypothetical protein